MIHWEIILNIWAALFIYNVLIKAIFGSMLSASMSGKSGEKVRKTFKERIEELDNKNDKA
jgi:hypothetical protein